MNERIRELHCEAETWVADNFSTIELNPYEWWEKEEQKFAELIIQECIDIVKEDKRISWDDSVNLIDSIKDNFGV